MADLRTHAREPVRADVAGVVGCAVAAFALTLIDVFEAAQRPPAPSLTGLWTLAAVGVPLGTFLATVTLAVRALAVRALRRRVSGGALVAGALDMTALFCLAVIAQDPRLLAEANMRTAIFAAAIAVGGVAGWAWERFLRPRARVAAIIAGIAAAGALATTFLVRWNGDPWFRLALHAVLFVAFARALHSYLARPSWRVVAVGLGALALVGASAWWLALPASMSGRLALYHRSSHVRSWAYVLEAVVGSRSTAPRDALVSNTRAHPPGANHGVARGSDVFLFSVDSLRWDAVTELAPLRDVLGPHVVFTTAVSPAPATRDSLAATLRGRAVGQLVVGPAPSARGDIVWRDPSPTIAHVLVAAGYRAVTIPTSNQSDPRLGIQSGFETLWSVNHDAIDRAHIRSPFKLSYTRGHDVVPVVREVARRTPGPLLLWVHFMEPHYSYHWSPTEEGPRGVAAYRKAVRYEAELLAGLVRDLRRIRGRPAVVSVFGDHGEEFGEHGGNYHGTTVHAEQARVAWLLAAPGLGARHEAAPVSTASLPTTILDLLGLAAPATMTYGNLFGPSAPTAVERACVITEMRATYREATGYTMKRYRLVRDGRRDVDQLFDLAQDPYERHDLALERPQDLIEARHRARACHGFLSTPPFRYLSRGAPDPRL